jgi:hypothetical protein
MKSVLLSIVALVGLTASASACHVSGLGCHVQAAVVQQVIPIQTFAVAPVAIVQAQVVAVPTVAQVQVQQVSVVQVLAAPVVKVKNFCARGHCGGARVQVFGGGRSVVRQRTVIRSR